MHINRLTVMQGRKKFCALLNKTNHSRIASPAYAAYNGRIFYLPPLVDYKSYNNLPFSTGIAAIFGVLQFALQVG